MPENRIDPKFVGDGSLGGEMEALVAIMKRLRAPDGCPWDLKQTHKSLRPYLLEETYEVIECLDKGEYEKLGVELGDLLLQVVFHSQIASETDLFDILTPIRSIKQKMLDRHPHVFSDIKADTADDVRDLWEKIKLEEGKKNGDKENGTLSGVPNALPALTRAFRVQEKMAGVGFDWEEPQGALEKLREEMDEASEAILSGDRDHAEEEIGDLLFSVVNAARLAGFGAEEALRRSTEKVMARFKVMEEMAGSDDNSLPDMTLEEMDVYWEKAKQRERGKK